MCAPEGGQTMPLHFKVDILDALKEKGYTTYTLRKENILSQSTIQKLREGKGLAWDFSFITDILHTGSNGHDVEIIIDKNNDSEKYRHHHGDPFIFTEAA